MKLRSFVGFVAPSVLLMLALLALPMVMTVLLSVRNCALQMELVTVQQTGLFGAHAVTTQRAQVDAGGRPVQVCRWVGLDYYRTVLGLDTTAGPAAATVSGAKAGAKAGAQAGAAGTTATAAATSEPPEFFSALRVTLL